MLKAGWNFCDITELFHDRYEVPAAQMEPGLYRNITGNMSLAMGLIAASRRSGLPLFLGAYPITPASDVLHELSRYKNFGVTTFQAEDEIAAVCSAIGASFGGALGVTASSGPGIALKAEAMNLAVMTELPLVVCDIQRGGPSTGLPTKTEQADLLQVMFGRNGESPMPIISASSPKDCFDVALEAVRIATRYMVPVVLLSDGYIANGSEPWKLPEVEDLPDLRIEFRTDPEGFHPYERDAETLCRARGPSPARRAWSTASAASRRRTSPATSPTIRSTTRTWSTCGPRRWRGSPASIPDVEVFGDPEGGELLVIGWGSTAGAIHRRGQQRPAAGLTVSRAHLRYLNPFPRNLGDVLARFDRVLLPEMNLGQLALLLRARYLKDVVTLSKVQGKPFTPSRDPGQDPVDPGVRSMPTETPAPTRRLTKKDFQTDQEVRWCPGCGDYAILSAVQQVFPELGIPREKFVVVSGIGCSSRFPYYMNTFGFHTIHGRAPAVATGLKLARPELEVWIATGDGDSMSIGGNHLIHVLRRNVGVKILMFNNRIYGLTKGQYSPTSELGKKTKSTPAGSVDYPFNPLSLAIGAGATFVARSVDIFQAHLRDTLRRAAQHKGTAYVEIYQNCNIFNDKAFANLTDKETKDETALYLEHGKPLVFGKNKDRGIRMQGDADGGHRAGRRAQRRRLPGLGRDAGEPRHCLPDGAAPAAALPDPARRLPRRRAARPTRSG